MCYWKHQIVPDEASKEDINLSESEKFSCNLATILARDREVVAVNLKILSNNYKVYIAKNSAWSENDRKYIYEIKEYLELDYRLDKLKNDIIYSKNKSHIKSFLEFAKINVVNIDKAGSYVGSLMDITDCILLWPIKDFIPAQYEDFKKACLEDEEVRIECIDQNNGPGQEKWKLPDTFKKEFVSNTLFDLDQIIESGIEHFNSMISSDGESVINILMIDNIEFSDDFNKDNFY
ncbi:9054_t:CDS:2 [Diversispora eburnea]|uniref:9054_t:CDS:1 n=1 Tax=Diversispora eburnea TaxID=1213867 RepID=A0A9N9F873_9GLOM|nr:9054_t:CDS:2 [Diversispora eburnea]